MKKEQIEKYYTNFISKEAKPSDFHPKNIGGFMVRIFEAGTKINPNWNFPEMNEFPEKSRKIITENEELLEYVGDDIPENYDKSINKSILKENNVAWMYLPTY